MTRPRSLVYFTQDFSDRFGWYLEVAEPEIARHFQSALDRTLKRLAQHPELGRLRNFKHPRLQGIRSLAVERPFNRVIIFYRVGSDSLDAIRLLHGARDFPRRLLEPPDSESQ